MTYPKILVNLSVFYPENMAEHLDKGTPINHSCPETEPKFNVAPFPYDIKGWFAQTDFEIFLADDIIPRESRMEFTGKFQRNQTGLPSQIEGFTFDPFGKAAFKGVWGRDSSGIETIAFIKRYVEFGSPRGHATPILYRIARADDNWKGVYVMGSKDGATPVPDVETLLMLTEKELYGRNTDSNGRGKTECVITPL